MMMLAAAVFGGPAAGWKLASDTFTATADGSYPLSGTGQEIIATRAQWLGGGTNSLSVSVDLVAARDSYTNALAAFAWSSATASDRCTNLCLRTAATNALARAGDRISLRASNVTNGLVTVLYWYYE